MNDTRRRLPRQPADWPGTYEFAENVTAHGSCRVVDISRFGLGVELHSSTPVDPIGKRLVVDVRGPASGSVSIHMEGLVRNVSRGQGGVRVGVEFVGLSPVELAILDSLEQMQVGW